MGENSCPFVEIDTSLNLGNGSLVLFLTPFLLKSSFVPNTSIPKCFTSANMAVNDQLILMVLPIIRKSEELPRNGFRGVLPEKLN